MAEVGATGAFEWSVPYDRALRRARAMFLFCAALTTLYIVVPFFTLLIVLRVDEGSPWRRVDSVLRDLGPVGVVGVVVATLAIVTATVAAIAWRGLPGAIVRVVGARAATHDEARLAAAGVEPFALARGISPPRVWVIDDDAPNTLSFGRPTAAHVCFTKGAFALPPDESAALCAFELTALTCAPYSYCAAAIDLILFSEWCTRALWLTAVIGFLSPIVGVSPEVAGVFVLCIAALVGVTRIALFFADRALPRLFDDVALLVDLEAVRLTARPASFAGLITDLLDDHRRVCTRWPVAHLWFERDTIEVRSKWTGLLGFVSRIAPGDVGVPDLAARFERADPRGLHDRAQRALNQANGVVRRPDA